jgi:sporulation protein YlmC with PRC-barrel domain
MKLAPLLVGALFAATAANVGWSQSTAPTPADRANVVVAKYNGQWRASKLIGLNVYNEKGEKLGDINEVILDRNGKVENFVIGVGGFLGMGEHDIAVGLDKLKFVDTPVRSTDARPAPAERREAAATAARNWYPDHAVLNASKDQLKAMPEFKYSNYN